jgi:hypothetical protein
MSDVRIEVEAHAGYRGDERPRRFVVEGEPVTVIEILRMWVEEDQESRGRKRSFLVKGNDGFLYSIYYDLELLAWYLRGRE